MSKKGPVHDQCGSKSTETGTSNLHDDITKTGGNEIKKRHEGYEFETENE